MNNSFGFENYEIKEVLKDKQVEETVKSMLFSVLKHLGIPAKNSERIIRECLSCAKNYFAISEYENKAHSILESEGVAKIIPEKLSARASIIHNQIKPHLLDGKVLDLGCGDGKVGELISKGGYNVVLADIYEHEHITKTNLPFKLFKPNKSIPFKDNEFDNTLALTVYHHSDDPMHTIKESFRVTKPNGRVLVIESVYGVHGECLSDKEKWKIESYISITDEQQRKVNIFFDHFYNRVIHFNKETKNKVNVPFNFNTPQKWKAIFAQNGFEEEAVIHLGSDQPTVPEYHTLHILRVKKQATEGK